MADLFNEELIPRLTVRDPSDANLIIESLSVYGHWRMTTLMEDAKRMRAVGKHSVAKELDDSATDVADQITELLELLRREEERANHKRAK
jgi:hypothetical protein